MAPRRRTQQGMGGVICGEKYRYSPQFSNKWDEIQILYGVIRSKCSQDTALWDIQQLVERGVRVNLQGGGRSTGYDINEDS